LEERINNLKRSFKLHKSDYLSKEKRISEILGDEKEKKQKSSFVMRREHKDYEKANRGVSYERKISKWK
jgi:hypothetical protein